MKPWSDDVSANARLKKRETEVVASSLIVAVLVHLGVVLLMPPIAVAEWGPTTGGDMEVLPYFELPLPTAPKPLDKPAIPVPTADVSPEATIEVVGWSEVVENDPPPPPPDRSRATDRDAFGFTPYTVAPRLTNAADFQRELLRAYPRVLRDAGVGGVVTMLVHISAEGRVLDARIGTSSGYDLFDQAALSVADEMSFSGALNGTERVAVWVEIPLEFRIR